MQNQKFKEPLWQKQGSDPPKELNFMAKQLSSGSRIHEAGFLGNQQRTNAFDYTSPISGNKKKSALKRHDTNYFNNFGQRPAELGRPSYVESDSSPVNWK